VNDFIMLSVANGASRSDLLSFGRTIRNGYHNEMWRQPKHVVVVKKRNLFISEVASLE